MAGSLGAEGNLKQATACLLGNLPAGGGVGVAVPAFSARFRGNGPVSGAWLYQKQTGEPRETASGLPGQIGTPVPVGNSRHPVRGRGGQSPLFTGVRALFAFVTRLVGVGATGRTAGRAGRLFLAATGRLGGLARAAAVGTALLAAALRRAALFGAAGGAAGSRLAAGGLTRTADTAGRAALRILGTAREPRLGLGAARAIGHRVADPHEGGERQSETERLESRHGIISKMVWMNKIRGRVRTPTHRLGRSGQDSAVGGPAGPTDRCGTFRSEQSASRPDSPGSGEPSRDGGPAAGGDSHGTAASNPGNSQTGCVWPTLNRARDTAPHAAIPPGGKSPRMHNAVNDPK